VDLDVLDFDLDFDKLDGGLTKREMSQSCVIWVLAFVGKGETKEKEGGT